MELRLPFTAIAVLLVSFFVTQLTDTQRPSLLLHSLSHNPPLLPTISLAPTGSAGIGDGWPDEVVRLRVRSLVAGSPPLELQIWDVKVFLSQMEVSNGLTKPLSFAIPTFLMTMGRHWKKDGEEMRVVRFV